MIMARKYKERIKGSEIILRLLIVPLDTHASAFNDFTMESYVTCNRTIEQNI